MSRLGRYYEIRSYLAQHEIGRRVSWRALDDARGEFPRRLPELIWCNPVTGVDSYQLTVLNEWLIHGA